MADNEELITALRSPPPPRNAMAVPGYNAMGFNPLADALMGLRARIPENTEHSISLANMLRDGLGTAAGWMDWQNRVTPDQYSPQEIMAPLGMSTAGSPATAAAHAINTAAGDRTLDALRYHLRQISHDDGWPSRLGKGAFAASPTVTEAALAPFQGEAAPWMMGAAAGTSALGAYAFLRPHWDMLMKKRQYLRDMDERMAARDLPKPDQK